MFNYKCLILFLYEDSIFTTYGISLFSKLKIFSLVISDNVKLISLLTILLSLSLNIHSLTVESSDIFFNNLLIPIFLTDIGKMSEKSNSELNS